ncbi:MAG: hypothetical protein ACYC2K_10040, partial [Gemmatimonadales bacterium]
MQDFPVSRRLIAGLPGWLSQLLAMYPAPERHPPGSRDWQWRFPTEAPDVVLIAKAVRLASGIRAAFLLADAGHITEAGAILRVVADLADEVIFLVHGLIRGELTEAQQRFVTLFFRSMPRTPEEFEAREREIYVSRKEIHKAHRELAEGAAGKGDEMVRNMRFLNNGLVSYVHGGYETAMELYHGGRREFEVTG